MSHWTKKPEVPQWSQSDSMVKERNYILYSALLVNVNKAIGVSLVKGTQA
jgi:hypothetical protein